MERNLKKLVVYYSFEGNTAFIAETIAKAVGADILKLRPKKELKSRGFIKYLWGSMQVIMKTKPELHPFDKDPAKYDVLFIGTPVWASNYAASVRAFLSQKLNGKKIALFCCFGGNEGKTLRNMGGELAGNEIIGTKGFREPLRSKADSSKAAKDWAKQIIRKL